MHILNNDDLGKWLSEGKEMVGWVKQEGMSGFRFVPSTSGNSGPFTDQMWITSSSAVVPPLSAVEKLVRGAAVNSVKTVFVVTRYGIYRLMMLGHALNDGRVIHNSRVHSPIDMYSKLHDLLTGNAASVPVAAAMRAVKKLVSYTGLGMEFHPVDYSKPTWTLVPIDHNHTNLIRILVFIVGIGCIALFALMLHRS